LRKNDEVRHYKMTTTKNHKGKLALLTFFIAIALSLPLSAAPNPSSRTLEAMVKLSDILDNHTIFSAPQEGSETAGGLVGNEESKIPDLFQHKVEIYWRFNNDSAVGEAYNGTNASLVYLVNPAGFIRNYESSDSQFDYSGEGNNGVNYNGTYNASGGKFGGAFEFDERGIMWI